MPAWLSSIILVMACIAILLKVINKEKFYLLSVFIYLFIHIEINIKPQQFKQEGKENYVQVYVNIEYRILLEKNTKE